jgi:undecaprenyl-diphosphatase
VAAGGKIGRDSPPDRVLVRGDFPMQPNPPRRHESTFPPWWRRPLIIGVLLAVLCVVGGFLEMAGEIREKETRKFDETILLAMRVPGDTADPAGGPRVEEMARDLTALGGVTVLTLVTLTAFGTALFAGRRKLAWLGLAFVVSGSAMGSILKSGYDRPRPELFEHGVAVTSASFPSGHSMMSAIVWLTLGILVARTRARRRERVFIVVISCSITLLVGVSRIYLGVHWPTDVAGGWMLGAAWALIFWLVAMKVDPVRNSK